MSPSLTSFYKLILYIFFFSRVSKKLRESLVDQSTAGLQSASLCTDKFQFVF